MTPEQLATLKAYIAADPVLSAYPMNSDGAFEIAAALNQPANPTFYVWSESVSLASIVNNGFDWVRVDNLSVGKARIWDWMFADGFVNAAKANVRAGIAEVWKGTVADNAVRLTVFQHCQRPASVVEKLLASGAGTATSVDGVGPATAAFSGTVSYQEVQAARSL